MLLEIDQQSLEDESGKYQNVCASLNCMLRDFLFATACKFQYNRQANNESQVLKSPGYPTLYMKSWSCSWIITARPGFYVQLIFTDVKSKRFTDSILVSVA